MHPNYGVVVVVKVVVKRDESIAEVIDFEEISEKLIVFSISLVEQIL